MFILNRLQKSANFSYELQVRRVNFLTTNFDPHFRGHEVKLESSYTLSESRFYCFFDRQKAFYILIYRI